MGACAFSETESTETKAVARAVLRIDDIIFHVWANHKAVLGVSFAHGSRAARRDRGSRVRFWGAYVGVYF